MKNIEQKNKYTKELSEEIKKLELEIKKQELLNKLENIRRKNIKIIFIDSNKKDNRPSFLGTLFNK